MSLYADLYTMSEDDRIELIGEAVMDGPLINGLPADISFMVEDDEKANRYLDKLKNRWPMVIEIERKPGLVPNTVLVKLGRKTQ